MKKSRFLYLHSEVNFGKIDSLEKLHVVYTNYLEVCVKEMLAAHKFSMRLKDKKAFFPSCAELSSGIVKNVQGHAIEIVNGWASSKYVTKLRSIIKRKFKEGKINEMQRYCLFTIGKHKVDEPSNKITKEDIDLYWSWLLDVNMVGEAPSISHNVGMRMGEFTAVLSSSEETKLTTWWLRFSHLNIGKSRIQLPLVANPYIKNVNDVSKGILARKTKQGQWRFEVVDRKEWFVPEPTKDAQKIGVDVGFNVIATTSKGELLGVSMKPKFDDLYDKVRKIRANRQRQNLKKNSLRLDCLESKLTGMVKTMVGECANKLIKTHPGVIFVIEDLDLRGCFGAKRFAYRALHHNLGTKAICEVVNPAYTSQMCPSCGYVSKKNRVGIKFCCQSCGRKSHADVIGGINLLGRSEDKQIDLDDHPSVVVTILRERYLRRRSSSSGGKLEFVPSNLKLTTKVRPRKVCTGTVLNQVVIQPTQLERDGAIS